MACCDTQCHTCTSRHWEAGRGPAAQTQAMWHMSRSHAWRVYLPIWPMHSAMLRATPPGSCLTVPGTVPPGCKGHPSWAFACREHKLSEVLSKPPSQLEQNRAFRTCRSSTAPPRITTGHSMTTPSAMKRPVRVCSDQVLSPDRRHFCRWSGSNFASSVRTAL